MGNILQTIAQCVDDLARLAQESKTAEAALKAIFSDFRATLHQLLSREDVLRNIIELEKDRRRTAIILDVHHCIAVVANIGANREMRFVAARRLASTLRLPTTLKSKDAREALGNYGVRSRRLSTADQVRLLREELFPAGLILAVGEMDRPQHVRLGKKWIVDDRGHIKELVPLDDLRGGEFFHWLIQETFKAVTADLLDHSYPEHSEPPKLVLDGPSGGLPTSPGGRFPTADKQAEQEGRDEEAILSEIVHKNPGWIVAFLEIPESAEERLLAWETRKEASQDVWKLQKAATPAELRLIRKALEEWGDLVDLLRKEGRSRATIRKIRQRLRDKLRRSKSKHKS